MTKKILEVKNLSKSFDKKVLDNINMDVNLGEIVGFIGPNGAGKSTTLKCITNLIFPDEGSIEINGYDLKTQREKALKSQSAIIENPGLYPDLSGIENINLFAKLRDISKTRIAEIIEFIDIGSAINRKVASYSLGMKQRLGLGITLMPKAPLLMLDEPTNGLDPTFIIKFRDELKRLVREDGISILFSSHQLSEVEKIAERIICINRGKIVETPKNLFAQTIYKVLTPQAEKVQDIFSKRYGCKPDELGYLELNLGDDKLQFVLEEFSKHDIYIEDLIKAQMDIEDIYRSIYF